MLLNLNKIDDKQLLRTRIGDLSLSLDNCDFLKSRIKGLYNELESKGFLFFKPKVYLGEEWYSIEGTLTIFLPFYLVHSRLRQLEKKMMGEVEGSTKDLCMLLLRHEAGHCFDHAFKLSKTKEWKKLFGNSRKKYNPDSYKVIKHSKKFVINLADHYAQAHPDEDFAETFAVWLRYDKRTWTNKYRRWPVALSKLRYVDRIVRKLREEKPYVKIDRVRGKSLDLRRTLNSYYNSKRA